MNKIKTFLLQLFGSVPSTKKTISEQAQAFIDTANDEMLAQQAEHAANWRYGKEKAWTADLEAGVIVFQFHGARTGTSHFQTIGIYNEIDNSFAWGWAQTKIPPSLREHATIARHWGRAQKHPMFQNKVVQCTMEDAWQFAAVTRKLTGAYSIYRGRVGSRYIFMTTDEIHIDGIREQAERQLNKANSLPIAPPDNPTKAAIDRSAGSHWANVRRNLHWK
ncbi:DUF6882 domain-containing protein [Undibacterium fentianense]|uniref:Uncharacterized protein n=1 Tax=Undibacterium fentianense TaxID=2828728 RepID=A0A941IF24_9BURK|nr:DUF6882 domain-containing protein [Undibacterium fentianense]MBR7800266.1 hypothetical protein [Undibacterium fentianense]